MTEAGFAPGSALQILRCLRAAGAVAGCGVRPSGVIPGVPAPVGAVTGTVLYLVRDGHPVLTLRQSTVDQSPIGALTLLAAGPTPDERSRGLTSEVPADALPLAVADSASGVTVTFSSDVSVLSTVAIEQIACTVVSGTPVTVAGGNERRDPVTCPS